MTGTVFSLVLLICVFATNVDSHPRIKEQNLTALSNETTHIEHVTKTHTWHAKHLYFVPFARPFRDSDSSACNASSGGDDDDFPYFLTETQILHGGIILVILIGTYGFTLLAVVCNDYFLPCVETICEKLNLTPDVAAATFMSIATSTPEFFTNSIGTFITESDLGIGTIVGSSMFNALGVPAIGGLASVRPLQLDWYPLTRDTLIYIIAVSILIYISWDGNIYWYETLISLAFYIIYFVIMINNKRISKFVRKLLNKEEINVTTANDQLKDVIESVEKKRKSHNVNDDDLPKLSHLSAYGTYMDGHADPNYENEHQKVLETIQEEVKKEAEKSIFRKPTGNIFQKFMFYYTWPLKLLLKYTVPNPTVHPSLFPITFLMCIVWIGANSYVVSWMISIIGTITHLQDALLGMTVMAVGGCVPETVSMTILARRGEGGFGVSNSLGANTMNILYSLGLSWLLKSLINGQKTPIKIHSGSLEYTIMSLIVAASSLYIILLFSKFRLSKTSGSIIGIFYIAAVVLAILTQTVFSKSNDC
ncbi:unnamed protein product [Psylliodes chrysocephalus]|uniref:Sodium/calcium exchanger membrane region domain-containing protein n=1 Tax=Psylliodes chrysocephalus TaxID=3402493 RepID=A0A9P0GH25_9CUCU|nr:unnamed protein product [Psylliodes chrysocephala]